MPADTPTASRSLPFSAWMVRPPLSDTVLPAPVMRACVSRVMRLTPIAPPIPTRPPKPTPPPMAMTSPMSLARKKPAPVSVAPVSFRAAMVVASIWLMETEPATVTLALFVSPAAPTVPVMKSPERSAVRRSPRPVSVAPMISARVSASTSL
jgi:hypothetical protein